jgi:hypothetical protein
MVFVTCAFLVYLQPAPQHPAVHQPPAQHPTTQTAATMADVVKATIVAVRAHKPCSDSSALELPDTAEHGDASDTQSTKYLKQPQCKAQSAGNRSPVQHLKATAKHAGTGKPTFLKVVKAMNAGAADGKLQSKVSKEGKAAAVGVGVGSGPGQPLKPKSATKFKVTSGAGKIKVLYRDT